jgi:drug/metabolite transporter (DMT)-like permease
LVTSEEALMHRADLAALLALGAAFFIAIGDVIQQRSAKDVTDEPVGYVQLVARLLRDRKWWLGTIVGTAGFGLQAAALGFGSVLLVQALLVTSLLFALPMSARAAHRRVTRWEMVWAVVLAGSVAVIVTVGDPHHGQARASLETWAVVVAVLGPLIALCLIGAQMCSGDISALLLGVVSGSLWGLFAVLTKGVVDQLDDGIWPLLRSPELYAWALVAILAATLQQSSFRAGTMTASLPAMTVAEPVVGSVLGIVVLGESLRTTDLGWLALGVAIAAMIVATAALARGQALGADSPADNDTTAKSARLT